MTVTKQQQLEWLVRNGVIVNLDGIAMSCDKLGWQCGFFSDSYHEITREEWQRERDKMQKKNDNTRDLADAAKEIEKIDRQINVYSTKQDNSWHERGEFPPAGCECEVKYRGEWIKTVIIGMSPYNSCVFSLVGHPDCPAYDGMSPASSFRPLRTEREKAIDEMIDVAHSAGCFVSSDSMASLYDAGYRKEKNK